VATAQALFSSKPLEIFDFAAQQCEQAPFAQRLGIAREWLDGNTTPSANEVRMKLGSGIAAVESCVTALYVSVRFVHEPFEELQRFVAECRGDVDTIGAMSGAIWGAANGSSLLPERLLGALEDRTRIEAVAEALYRVSATG
jgi:poly(ADP-ribose) glycohydrolase ARH3